MVRQGKENINMRKAADIGNSRNKALRKAPIKNGPQRPSPVAAITKIGLMKRFFDPDVALDKLHELARLVGPLMHRHRFKVGVLCEFYPKQPNLLGLNVNAGAKIMVRLRRAGSLLFIPMNELVGTLLHELTHNLYLAHDAQFYGFLDKLTEEYEDIHFRGLGLSPSEYVCEQNTLGHSTGRLPSNTYQSEREKRIKAMTKNTYKSERKKLGTSIGVRTAAGVKTPLKPKVGTAGFREAVLAAAERRLADSKWCSDRLGLAEDVPPDEDLVTVIDLTNDEYDDEQIRTPLNEIVEIDGCSTENKFSPSDISKEDENNLTSNIPEEDKEEAPVTQLLEPFESSVSDEEDRTESDISDEIYQSTVTQREPVGYLVSVSPNRSFFNDGIIYPRRKYVANLTFEEIIRRSREIENHLQQKQQQHQQMESPASTITNKTYVLTRPTKFKSKKTSSTGRLDKVTRKARPTPTRTLHKALRKPSPAPEPQSHAKTV